MTQPFEDLVPDLQRFTRRLVGNTDLADDVAQESLVRAVRATQRGTAVGNVRVWLFQIATNVFRQWWRKQQREQAVVQARGEQQSGSIVACPAGVAEQREYLQNVAAFLQDLPDQQRQVLLLNIREGLRPAEIAERLQLSVGNVRSHLHAARTKLRNRFLDSPS